MNCPMCGIDGCVPLFIYDRPPDGETRFPLSGAGPYFRRILECPSCHHMVSVCAFDFGDLYQNDYANSTYGAAGIEDEYQRIVSLLPEKSDNTGRVERLMQWLGTANRGGEDIPCLLDVGCGLGVFLSAMKTQGWRCDAVEPDPLLAAQAKKLIDGRVFQTDFMTLSPTRRYDIISFNKVLEHVADPIQMLHQSLLFLKPRGVVYIELPDGEQAKIEGQGREEFFIEHLHIFSRASFEQLAARAGLRLIRETRLEEPSGKFTLAALAVPDDFG